MRVCDLRSNVTKVWVLWPTLDKVTGACEYNMVLRLASFRSVLRSNSQAAARCVESKPALSAFMGSSLAAATTRSSQQPRVSRQGFVPLADPTISVT